MSREVPLYDRFSGSYDVMVDWQERLLREDSFLRKVFERAGARRVLDVGCATGGHVLRFAEMGAEATGADPSGEMIRVARERAEGRPDVGFVQAGFGELRDSVEGSFDLVTCLGNTLPHATAPGELDRALSDVAAILRPGGILAIQLLNYDRILAEKRRFLGVSSGHRDGSEFLFFRFYDFDEPLLTFNVVTLTNPGGGWGFGVESTRLRPIRRAELRDSLVRAGFEQIDWAGNMAGDRFDEAESNDLVVVATRS